MHSVASRVLVGLGVAVAALVAIGYAFIFSGIATPVSNDLGTVEIPDDSTPVPVYLADGRPAFVVRSGDGAIVIDARPQHEAGLPGHLVAWCNGLFWDLAGTGIYAPGGGLVGGDAPGSLIVYPTSLAPSGDEVTVAAAGRPAADRFGELAGQCNAWEATMHAPEESEIFDPSVAADQEPPGWVWLEGSLVAIGGQAMLCDSGSDCAAGAVARGIDPAKVPQGEAALDGLFIGRIRDGAIDELDYVPHREAGR